jgi:CheY-like chemotaxis protein
MSPDLPIIVVEDDADDQELIIVAIKQSGFQNPVMIFDNGMDFLAYLRATDVDPFIIICDIQLPSMDGIEIKQHINNEPELRSKSIPFVYLASVVNQLVLDEVFKSTVQGFFEKGKNFEELATTVKFVLEYWEDSLHPKRFS